MITIRTPVGDNEIKNLRVGQKIQITGSILTGRDAVLPKVVSLIKNGELKSAGIELQGSIIFHTAVSPAGIGPTSSNKLDIENNIPQLARAGVKIHIGKGELKETTIKALEENNSIFAIVPPVTSLLLSKVKRKEILAFPEEGMEAMFLLQVENFPAIVSVAHGKTLFSGSGNGGKNGDAEFSSEKS